ncbi:hypothetical protein SAMN04490244_11748 [Tranquillimonas rosea]|uniref:DUF1508 domain-containing protein n=1 Tax=Tranquillimonas rosea TaxID=641238 RepID=A0A1H9X4D5_9RHOB|nr:YegP family protein [Tranquillimonas rosea]SES40727.1 hypothetical protein SAMN04490244_11748 [Tranquillimonas rosea]
MAGKFELYRDRAGEFRFRLKAGNGRIILVSEGYKRKPSATKGIASVRRNATKDMQFERTETSDGKYRFNLRATNGQVVGTSESYESVSTRDNGIAAVMSTAPEATVEEMG